MEIWHLIGPAISAAVAVFFTNKKNGLDMEHRLTAIETILKTLPCEKGKNVCPPLK